MWSLEEYEKRIGYHFKNKQLLETALTHSSFANEHKCKSYERLEFLGDSVLGLSLRNTCLKISPSFRKGELTKTRASLVCERSLCGFSKTLHVGDFLRLSHGEQQLRRPGAVLSILADAFEVHHRGHLPGRRQFGGSARNLFCGLSCPAAKAQSVKPFKDYKTSFAGDHPAEPGGAAGIRGHWGKRPGSRQAFYRGSAFELQCDRQRRRPQQKGSGAAGRPGSLGADGILNTGKYRAVRAPCGLSLPVQLLRPAGHHRRSAASYPRPGVGSRQSRCGPVGGWGKPDGDRLFWRQLYRHPPGVYGGAVGTCEESGGALGVLRDPVFHPA